MIPPDSPARRPGRPPVTKAGERHQDGALLAHDKILRLAEKGHLVRASGDLYKAALALRGKGRRRKRPGHAILSRAYVSIADRCSELGVPAPWRLNTAARLLLDVSKHETGPKWAGASFAAQFSDMKDVPTGALAKIAGVDNKTALKWKNDNEFCQLVKKLRAGNLTNTESKARATAHAEVADLQQLHAVALGALAEPQHPEAGKSEPAPTRRRQK
jgi:hypothetical protein